MIRSVANKYLVVLFFHPAPLPTNLFSENQMLPTSLFAENQMLPTSFIFRKSNAPHKFIFRKSNAIATTNKRDILFLVSTLALVGHLIVSKYCAVPLFRGERFQDYS